MQKQGKWIVYVFIAGRLSKYEVQTYVEHKNRYICTLMIYNLIRSLSVTGDRKIKAYLLNIAVLFKRR